MSTTLPNSKRKLHTETEAAVIRKRNETHEKSADRRRVHFRDRVDDIHIARELGVKVADLY